MKHLWLVIVWALITLPLTPLLAAIIIYTMTPDWGVIP